MREAFSEKKAHAKNRPRRVSRRLRYWYYLCRWTVMLFLMTCFRIRFFGIPNVTSVQGALLVSNHQSFLDPMALGAAIPEKINFLARQTLFKFKPFGKLLDSLDTIPLNQEGIGFEGIKETMKRLKNNEKVLIFPEGARCWDGEMLPFKKGVMSIAVRAGVPIVPMAMAGAHESWPRGKALPTLFSDNNSAIRVIYGEPISADQASAMSEDELHDFVEQRVRELYQQLQENRKLVR